MIFENILDGFLNIFLKLILNCFYFNYYDKSKIFKNHKITTDQMLTLARHNVDAIIQICTSVYPFVLGVPYIYHLCIYTLHTTRRSPCLRYIHIRCKINVFQLGIRLYTRAHTRLGSTQT